jgi:sugar/nucleoside kinase (ribokinase family)
MLNGLFPPLDYLVMGHLSSDRIPDGNTLGGTAAYAALTVAALGHKAGIVTAVGQDVSLSSISHIPRTGIDITQSTTFENRITPAGRNQILHHHAPVLSPKMVPRAWRETPIAHIGPIVHEIDSAMLDIFPSSFIVVTPQGWLRQWDDAGRVSPAEWPEFGKILSKAKATVISAEDVAWSEDRIDEMALVCPILVVTEGVHGARLFVQGSALRIDTAPMEEIDPTGAGDIFAASFFIHLYKSSDPVEAAHFATYLAAHSVTRPGLSGIPTREVIHSAWDIIKHDTYLHAC